MRDILFAIDHSIVYQIALVFYGLYPISMAIVWVVMAVLYFRRREVRSAELAPPDFVPFVSIVIPAFEEESTIAGTLAAALRIDYPNYEVVVVNDGSADGTAAVIESFVSNGRVRLVDKVVNEGKAMASTMRFRPAAARSFSAWIPMCCRSQKFCMRSFRTSLPRG